MNHNWEGNMRKVIFAFIGLTLLIVTLPSGTWGLAITKPISGTVFHPGDNVVVKAEASPGENLQGIFFFTDKVDESIFDLQPPYEFEFKIEPDFAGALTIVADGKLIDSKHVEARVQIIVALPVDVKLKSIEIDPNPVLLYKLPTGMIPTELEYLRQKIRSRWNLYRWD